MARWPERRTSGTCRPGRNLPRSASAAVLPRLAAPVLFDRSPSRGRHARFRPPRDRRPPEPALRLAGRRPRTGPRPGHGVRQPRWRRGGPSATGRATTASPTTGAGSQPAEISSGSAPAGSRPGIVAVTTAGALVLLDPAGGAITSTPVQGGVLGDEVAVSPDGSTIAFAVEPMLRQGCVPSQPNLAGDYQLVIRSLASGTEKILPLPPQVRRGGPVLADLASVLVGRQHHAGRVGLGRPGQRGLGSEPGRHGVGTLLRAARDRCPVRARHRLAGCQAELHQGGRVPARRQPVHQPGLLRRRQPRSVPA